MIHALDRLKTILSFLGLLRSLKILLVQYSNVPSGQSYKSKVIGAKRSGTTKYDTIRLLFLQLCKLRNYDFIAKIAVSNGYLNIFWLRVWFWHLVRKNLTSVFTYNHVNMNSFWVINSFAPHLDYERVRRKLHNSSNAAENCSSGFAGMLPLQTFIQIWTITVCWGKRYQNSQCFCIQFLATCCTHWIPEPSSAASNDNLVAWFSFKSIRSSSRASPSAIWAALKRNKSAVLPLFTSTELSSWEIPTKGRLQYVKMGGNHGLYRESVSVKKVGHLLGISFFPAKPERIPSIRGVPSAHKDPIICRSISFSLKKFFKQIDGARRRFQRFRKQEIFNDRHLFNKSNHKNALTVV